MRCIDSLEGSWNEADEYFTQYGFDLSTQGAKLAIRDVSVWGDNGRDDPIEKRALVETDFWDKQCWILVELEPGDDFIGHLRNLKKLHTVMGNISYSLLSEVILSAGEDTEAAFENITRK